MTKIDDVLKNEIIFRSPVLREIERSFDSQIFWGVRNKKKKKFLSCSVCKKKSTAPPATPSFSYSSSPPPFILSFFYFGQSSWEEATAEEEDKKGRRKRGFFIWVPRSASLTQIKSVILYCLVDIPTATPGLLKHCCYTTVVTLIKPEWRSRFITVASKFWSSDDEDLC